MSAKLCGNSALQPRSKTANCCHMKPSSPQNPVDLYFMDARSKLIDIAAFMARVHKDGLTEDFRYQAFLKALKELEGNAPKAESVLQAFSDPTTEVIPQATTKAACGAWPGEATPS